MDKAEVDREIEEAYYDEMARFCLATGYLPEVYWEMDQPTLAAFARMLEEQNNPQKEGVKE